VVGRADLIPPLIAVYMLPALVFVPLWIVLARRIGKKPLWLASMVVMTGAFGGLFFVERGDWLLVAILAGIAGVGGGCGAVVAPSIQADLIDWDELRTGERKEGAYFAVWSFVRKSVYGVTGALTGLMLMATGFTPGAEQDPDTLLGIRALFGLLPAACFALGTLLFLRFRFGRAEHGAVQEALAARRLGLLLMGTIGYPMVSAAAALGRAPELQVALYVLHAGLNFVGQTAILLFTWRVFRPAAGWATALVAVFAVTMAAVLVASALRASGVAMTPTRMGILVGPLGLVAAGSMWLAFLPPAGYVCWIEARAGTRA
jgi:MFS family permease